MLHHIPCLQKHHRRSTYSTRQKVPSIYNQQGNHFVAIFQEEKRVVDNKAMEFPQSLLPHCRCLNCCHHH